MWPPAVPLDPQELQRRRLLSATVGPQPLTPWPTLPTGVALPRISASLPTRASSCGNMVLGNSLPVQPQQFGRGNQGGLGNYGDRRVGASLPNQQLGPCSCGSAVVKQPAGFSRRSLALPSTATMAKLPETRADRSRTPRRPDGKAGKHGGRRHLCEVCSILCLTDSESSDSDSPDDESSSSDEE